MKEEILVCFRIVFRDGAMGERVILEEKRSLLSYASDWCTRPGAGPDWGRFRPQNVPGWFHPGSPDSCFVGDQKAALVYASSAKRTASTRAGPFLGTVFFFDRGLMMLIAEASSCVFKCAA